MVKYSKRVPYLKPSHTKVKGHTRTVRGKKVFVKPHMRSINKRQKKNIVQNALFELGRNDPTLGTSVDLFLELNHYIYDDIEEFNYYDNEDWGILIRVEGFDYFIASELMWASEMIYLMNKFDDWVIYLKDVNEDLYYDFVKRYSEMDDGDEEYFLWEELAGTEEEKYIVEMLSERLVNDTYVIPIGESDVSYHYSI